MAKWRLNWIFATIFWSTFAMIFFAVSISIESGQHVWSWVEIVAWIFVGSINLFLAGILTRDLIRKERVLFEERMPLEEMVEADELEDRKFLEVMAGLGFPNPLSDFLRLTRENKIQWERNSKYADGVCFYATNVVDGICLELEAARIDKELIYQELVFSDSAKRFKGRSFINITSSGEREIAREPEEKLVEGYSEWLFDKFKVELPEPV